MRDRYSININKGGGAIFSDENALLFFWFHSINLYCPGVGICGDDQGKVDAEKADRADKADGVYGVDRANRADKADRADKVDGANKADRADKTNGADKVDGVDRANEANRKNEADGADMKANKIDRSKAHAAKPEKSGTVVEDPGFGDLWIER